MLLLAACASPLPAALDLPDLPAQWRNDISPGRHATPHSASDAAPDRVSDAAPDIASKATPHSASDATSHSASDVTSDNASGAAPDSTSDAMPDNARWWTAFGSDVLNGLVEQSLSSNHDIQAARHRL
ncbi:MAG: hypothetical protein EON54_10520, partial [Alcaligenaceae bacterium]